MATVAFASGITGTSTCNTVTPSCNVTLSSLNVNVSPVYARCGVTDATGLVSTARCDFTLTIDKDLPSITCPADMDVSVVTGTSALVTATVTATDSIGVPTISCGAQDAIRTAGVTLPLGSTLVTCTATDSVGNTRSCSFNVNVQDTTLPVITCPANYEVFSDTGLSTGTVNWDAATASDNSGMVTVTCPTAGTTIYPIGDTMVPCSALDIGNNSVSCVFNITVVDNEDPVIFCPGAITEVLSLGAASRTITFSTSASDNDAIVSSPCDPPSGSMFPAGKTNVLCVATDFSGRTNTCSFLVTVVDTQAPMIKCPASYTVSTLASKDYATVSWDMPSEAAGTLSDNDQIASIACTVASSPSDFNVGLTQVTCTAKDASLNTAQCSFNVIVQDKEAPVITCPSNEQGLLYRCVMS